MPRDPLNAQDFKVLDAARPEDLWWPLYDRTNIATTVATESSFFAVPRGQSATLITAAAAPATKTKSYRDTNMDTAGVVPSKMHLIVGVSLGFVQQSRGASTNMVDRDYVRDGGFFRLKIIDKDIIYIPIMFIPEINPVSAISTTETSKTMIAQQSGGGYGKTMYRLPIKVAINPFENFSSSLTYDGSITLANSMDVYCVLQGFMRRPT